MNRSFVIRVTSNALRHVITLVLHRLVAFPIVVLGKWKNRSFYLMWTMDARLSLSAFSSFPLFLFCLLFHGRTDTEKNRGLKYFAHWIRGPSVSSWIHGPWASSKETHDLCRFPNPSQPLFFPSLQSHEPLLFGVHVKRAGCLQLLKRKRKSA